jgi:predicted metal-binding membrane protein
VAGVAWWVTAERMAGMDMGPGTDLGALGWFAGIWVVMMAAMMFPSVAPTVGIYARMTRGRDALAPALFLGGYLAVWSAAGIAAYGVFRAGRAVLGDDLHWHGAGRWVAGATLLLAAAYELTPLKNVCLSKCRSPVGYFMGAWRRGRVGALRMGAGHGAWCLGCCWALMAALFALGVMSLAWTAVVAALIALEKTLPWKRGAMFATTAILLALAIGVVAAPGDVPGLTVPM